MTTIALPRPRNDWLARLRTIIVLRGGQRVVNVPGVGVSVSRRAVASASGNGLLINLLAHWSLDEASGNRADDSGNSRTMLPYNAPGNQTGKISNAVDIEVASGTGKYLYYDDVASNLACPSGSSITVACWVYLDTSTAPEGFPLSRWGGTGDWALSIDATGKVYGLVESGSTDTAAATPAGTVTTSAWYYIVGWYDHTVGANGTVYVQVNNGTVYSKALATAKGNGARYVVIGDLSHTLVAYGSMDGAVDEAAIWRGVLTAEQRTALWNGGAGLAYADFTT